MKTTYGFSRRAPDLLAHEVATVLSGKTWFEFKEMFAVVFANLRARKAANGGEEMLRLRSYEKLQQLVSAGVVEKREKQYRGVPAALATFFQAADAANAAIVARTQTPAAPAAV
jgi:hypothetical protein